MPNKPLLFTVCVLAISTYAFGSLGSLDPAFGSGGIAVASVGNGSADTPYAAAEQPDGKLIVVGSTQSDSQFWGTEPVDLLVTRLHIDGSIDTSFGLNGIATKRVGLSRANSVVIQPDGKIVIAGYVILPQFGGSVCLLVRFLSDGAVDDSFGDDGVVITSFANLGQRGVLMSAALQSDGKIVATGYTYVSSTNSPFTIIVTRYNGDGSLDTTFDGDGIAFLNFGSNGYRGNALAIQVDGKIVVGGTFSSFGFVVVRLNSEGSLDNSFDTDGMVFTQFSGLATVLSIDVDPGGKIITGGSEAAGGSRNFALARYNPDGSLDTSFSTDGKLTFDLADDIYGGMALQPDGKILMCGNTLSNGFLSFLSIRYNDDGTLDLNYDDDGFVLTAVPGSYSKAVVPFVRPDSKIVLVGFSSTLPFASDITSAQYTSNGSLDMAYGDGGLSIVHLKNSADVIQSMAIQADGKIVAAGYSFSGSSMDITAARFLADGQLDTTFGIDGSVRRAFLHRDGKSPADTYTRRVSIQPDGKILLAVGFFDANRYVTMRYNIDGTLDLSYGTDGISTVTVGTDGDYCFGMILQDDGKIILAGSSFDNLAGEDASLIRLDPNGNLDTSFGENGTVFPQYPGRLNRMYDAIQQTDGKVLVAGTSSNNGQSFFVGRFNADGTNDMTFGDNGAAYASFATSASAKDMLLQSDGRIIASGFISAGPSFARFNTNGSLDTTFGVEGKLTIPYPAEGSYAISDFTQQSDGKLLLVGSLKPAFFSGSNRDSIVFQRNIDGSPDTSFGTQGQATYSIRGEKSEFMAVTTLPNGKVLAGGYSTNGTNDDFTLVQFQNTNRASFDYDGDARADISVFRPTTGDWYLQQSTAGFFGVNFGSAEDKIAPADYDGDGKTDVAVYRPSTGIWYITNSSIGTVSYYGFGVAEDLPVPADYDGDGKADITVFRPSSGTWYRQNSGNGQFVAGQFGAEGDRPTVGDFDGDGKADLAVFRPSTGAWYQTWSSNGFLFGEQFGISTDKITPADYDGDGKTDLAIYRPSEGLWYVKRSATTTYVPYVFGLAEDIPVPGDFDGDSKADIGVFRPSDGTWYIVNSSTGGYTIYQFGQNGDRPTQSAFASF